MIHYGLSAHRLGFKGRYGSQSTYRHKQASQRFPIPLILSRTRITAAADPGTHEETIMERTRAWRRHQVRKRGKNQAAQPLVLKPEKNWKFLYRRAEKLKRAHQLGICYPVRTTRQLLDQE